MREPLTVESLELFIKALARSAKTASRIYLVGGASAVLLGWRVATIDIDLKIVPETDEILRSLPKLKEQLHLNIELASPQDFIPELPGWEESFYSRGREPVLLSLRLLCPGFGQN